MKPAPFDYLRAETLAEALAALHEAGDEARVLAGGQSLVAMLNMRLARPELLVDIMGIAELRACRHENGTLVVPASVRQADLGRRAELGREVPLIAAMLPWLGHEQTRARGTVCGSIAHADPSAELPLALVALDGSVHLRSKRRRRKVAAREFFVGMMATEMRPGEMIEAVSIPLARPDRGHGFCEIGRRHGDFAIVAAAAVVDGAAIRLAIGGVDDVPAVRDWAGDTDLDDALNELAWSLDARDDLHASARYRRDLVRHLGARAIEEARACRA